MHTSPLVSCLAVSCVLICKGYINAEEKAVPFSIRTERSPRTEETLTREIGSRVAPPLSEIWSGKTLNTCIDKICVAHKRGGRGPNIPLDKEILAKVNVTRGEDGGSIGLLIKGALEWPEELQDAAYKTERKKIDELLQEAVKQAKKGEVATKLTEDLNQAIQKMNDRVDERCVKLPNDGLSRNRFIEAFRYFRALKQTVKALRRKDVRDYFTASTDLPVKCRTIADLVAYLSEKNLRIAPASPTDEAGYIVLSHLLAAYAVGITANPEKK